MEQTLLHIAFNDHQVVVHSDTPEVLAGLTPIFREMLVAEPAGKVAGRLEVRRHHDTYQLQGQRETRLQEGSLAEVLQCLQYEISLQLIQARPELLWLHAGAAAYQGQGVIIAGVSGRGKSTLVTQLCAQGWAYLSDDVLPLDRKQHKILPFPQMPWVRTDLKQEIPPDQVQQLKKSAVEIKPEAVCRQSVPITALIFPVYNLKLPTHLAPCSPAAAILELLQNCLNFVNHKEEAVAYLCDLTKQIPSFRLSFNSGRQAAALITQYCQEGRLGKRAAAIKQEVSLVS
jgi:hypothetical protein